MSNCSASCTSVRSPLIAAIATFALKADAWFRRGLLLMLSPDSRAKSCPLSGKSSTYRPVQILEAGSLCELIERAIQQSRCTESGAETARLVRPSRPQSHMLAYKDLTRRRDTETRLSLLTSVLPRCRPKRPRGIFFWGLQTGAGLGQHSRLMGES